MERRGFYTTTNTGGRWWPHDPRPEDVCVWDLAGLALVNRFGGATTYRYGPRLGLLAPYSVAQHSCLVYELVVEWGGSEQDLKDALCHDAHEAYPPGDQLSPVFRYDCPASAAIVAMSRAAATAVRTALGLSLVMPEIVKRADRTMLATERRDLMRPEPPEWGDNGREALPPRERRIECWDPDHAMNAFFRRFDLLFPNVGRGILPE